MLLWLHLAATGLFVGSTVGLAVFAVPAAARSGTGAAEQRRHLVRSLRVYDPLAIALLGIMVMTGAWSITELKQSLGMEYFAAFGTHLAWKLAGAFLVVMSGTYVTFGLGHRLVRGEEFGEPIDDQRMRSLFARLRGAAWTTVVLTGITIAIALRRAVP